MATEDVVYMLHGLNIKTGLDMETLFSAAGYIDEVLQRKSGSKVTQAYFAKLNKARRVAEAKAEASKSATSAIPNPSPNPNPNSNPAIPNPKPDMPSPS